METNEKISKLFGIDAETFEKSKDIKPTLQLGKTTPYNIPLSIEFLDAEPKTVATPNSKFKEESSVIGVIDLTTQIEYSLWLSSKTLRMGVAKLYEKHGDSLKGVKCTITKTKATFKEFGENDCYVVQEIKQE